MHDKFITTYTYNGHGVLKKVVYCIFCTNFAQNMHFGYLDLENNHFIGVVLRVRQVGAKRGKGGGGSTILKSHFECL